MCSKSSSTDGKDEKLCWVIIDKFKKLGKGNVSCIDIVCHVWEVDRAGLVNKMSMLHFSAISFTNVCLSKAP